MARTMDASFALWFPGVVLRRQTRSFVNLLHRVTGKYAHPNLEASLEIGDYGTLDKKTGEFVKEGNIFLRPNAPIRMQDKRTQETSQELIHYHVKQRVARSHNMPDLAVRLNYMKTNGQGEVKIVYEKKQTATLLFHNAISAELEHDAILRRALVTDPTLKHKAIITGYVECGRSALLVTNGKAGEATIKVTGGADVDNRQWSYTSTFEGCQWEEATHDAVHGYCPLYTLQQISGKAYSQDGAKFIDVKQDRGGPDFDPNEFFSEYRRPWGTIDEEGYDIDDEEDCEDTEDV